MFGSTEFADNQHLEGFQPRPFLNTVGWLAGQSAALDPPALAARLARHLTVNQFNAFSSLSVLLLPELLLIMGIVVWWERRN